jgi:hypothetical protein
MYAKAKSEECMLWGGGGWVSGSFPWVGGGERVQFHPNLVGGARLIWQGEGGRAPQA